MSISRNLGRVGVVGLVACLVGGAAVAGGGPAVAEPGYEPRVTVVASGLNNPRGVLLGPDGVLLVAEAGTGGDGPCVPSPEDENVDACLGATGSVSVVVPPHQPPFGLARADRSPRWRSYRIVRGLPSLAVADGSRALGPHDLAFGPGGLLASIGLGGDPQRRATLGAGGRLMGQVVRLRPFGSATPHADLVAFEESDPDGNGVDSNPYGLLGGWHGKTVAVDAGGNTVLTIDRRGMVAKLAVLPMGEALAPPFLGLPPGTKIPMQAVPTTVVRGPGGGLYVGQLTGFPFPPGGAQVWRIDAAGALTPYASGFTNIVDIAFDHQGRLLVLSIARNGLLNTPPGALPAGSLTRVERNGTRTELAAGKLTAPGGLVVARDGAIYVTNKSIVSGAGELLRIRG